MSIPQSLLVLQLLNYKPLPTKEGHRMSGQEEIWIVLSYEPSFYISRHIQA